MAEQPLPEVATFINNLLLNDASKSGTAKAAAADVDPRERFGNILSALRRDPAALEKVQGLGGGVKDLPGILGFSESQTKEFRQFFDERQEVKHETRHETKDSNFGKSDLELEEQRFASKSVENLEKGESAKLNKQEEIARNADSKIPATKEAEKAQVAKEDLRKEYTLADTESELEILAAKNAPKLDATVIGKPSSEAAAVKASANNPAAVDIVVGDKAEKVAVADKSTEGKAVKLAAGATEGVATKAEGVAAKADTSAAVGVKKIDPSSAQAIAANAIAGNPAGNLAGNLAGDLVGDKGNLAQGIPQSQAGAKLIGVPTSGAATSPELTQAAKDISQLTSLTAGNILQTADTGKAATKKLGVPQGISEAKLKELLPEVREVKVSSGQLNVGLDTGSGAEKTAAKAPDGVVSLNNLLLAQERLAQASPKAGQAEAAIENPKQEAAVKAEVPALTGKAEKLTTDPNLLARTNAQYVGGQSGAKTTQGAAQQQGLAATSGEAAVKTATGDTGGLGQQSSFQSRGEQGAQSALPLRGDQQKLGAADALPQAPITAASFVNSLGKTVSILPKEIIGARQQVAQSITQAVKNGEQKIDIKLNPGRLGSMEIRLEFDKEGAARITLVADKQETLEMLGREKSQILQSLQEQGVNLQRDALNFAFSGGRGGQEEQGDQESAIAGQGEELLEEDKLDQAKLDPEVDDFSERYTNTGALDVKV